jgi:ABC-type transport system substrate-binding protein
MNNRLSGGRRSRRLASHPATHRLAALGVAAALIGALLASCGPVAVDVPAVPSLTPAPPLPTAIPHADEIRFALVGKVNGGNVWATFDSRAYSYNDYAIRSGYWPRLYRLTIPEGRFEPLAARGMPSAVQAEGALFTATVPLRADLQWSDGSPLSADDVAFTVNTALAFQLGFDWHTYYDPAWLQHAEALDAHTVKFIFKRAPNVGVWQYGALQGPIVQRSYWEPRLEEASALLPSAESLQQIDTLEARIGDLQQRVQELVTSGFNLTGEEAHQLQIQLQNQQGDLDQARNDLAKQEAVIEASMQAARDALYMLDDRAEPVLGTWLPGKNTGGAWVNTANPSHPFEATNFDRAVYSFYPSQAAAVAALSAGKADVLLDPHGLSKEARAQLGSDAALHSNPTSSVRVLIINPTKPELADPALHHALFCAISRAALADSIDALPVTSLLGAGDSLWANAEAAVACPNGYDPLTGPDEPFQAAEILRLAGYTWAEEPSAGHAGSGLQQPGGGALRPFVLLAPDEESDPQSAAAARSVERSARALGIPLTVQSTDAAAIRFAVYNGHDYDFAITGWRLGAYPGYLCDWFGGGNPLGYVDAQVASECAAFGVTSDLEAARSRIFTIQSLLAQDPPFIPIFAVQTYELTRPIVYPFDRVMNGLSGVYGAPSLAMPSSAP